MAEAVGISPSSVGRIWAEAGLKSHLTKGFKVSNDPMFEEKVTDIFGLYLTLQSGRWCSASTKKLRSRRLIGPNPGCR